MSIKTLQKNICCIIGTRPEAIKMMPIVNELQKQDWAKLTIIASAQHRELLDSMLAIFNIRPDLDLNSMRPNQTLAALTARLTMELDDVLSKNPYDVVLAQGDTTTLFIASLICFYHRIPFAHVEAGLRTGDRYNPFPEEMNRTLTADLTTWHFAPSDTEKQNLLNQGIAADQIFVVGNTVIDAVNLIAQQHIPLDIPLDPTKRLIVVTAHRRESFGEPLRRICMAIRTLADRFDDAEFIYPVHPNPNVQTVVKELLSNHPRIKLIPPLDYEKFITLLKKCYLILTDSGGIQEEAPTLRKPVLVMRDKTERVAAVAAGVSKLVGTQQDAIVNATTELLTDPQVYASMINDISPYGKGDAAQKIVRILEEKLFEK